MMKLIPAFDDLGIDVDQKNVTGVLVNEHKVHISVLPDPIVKTIIILSVYFHIKMILYNLLFR